MAEEDDFLEHAKELDKVIANDKKISSPNAKIDYSDQKVTTIIARSYMMGLSPTQVAGLLGISERHWQYTLNQNESLQRIVNLAKSFAISKVSESYYSQAVSGKSESATRNWLRFNYPEKYSEAKELGESVLQVFTQLPDLLEAKKILFGEFEETKAIEPKKEPKRKRIHNTLIL